MNVLKSFAPILAAAVVAGCPAEISDESVKSRDSIKQESDGQAEYADTQELCIVLEKLGDLRSNIKARTISSVSVCPRPVRSFIDSGNCDEIADSQKREDCEQTWNMRGCSGTELVAPKTLELARSVLVRLDDGRIAKVECKYEREIPVTNPVPAHAESDFENALWTNPESIVPHPEVRQGPFVEANVRINGSNELRARQSEDYRDQLCTVPAMVIVQDNVAGMNSEIDGIVEDMCSDCDIAPKQRMFAATVAQCTQSIRDGRVWTEDDATCSQQQ